MDFNFLPQLPKSNLDDRTYQELVEECLLRIPRYCPEWTDYNASDPGITLIELFAWLTDQMLMRFNQVPRRNYVAFLELLGIRLQPPTPAKGEITFYLTASLPNPYTIPQYTEVATPRTETEEAVVFSTDKPLIIGNPLLKHFLSAPTPELESQNLSTPQSGFLRDRLSNFWERQGNGAWSGPQLNVFESSPQPGNSFYLILDSQASLDGNVIAIAFKGESATSTGINPKHPPRRWEAWNGKDWVEILLQETDDRTEGLSFSQITKAGGDPLTGADVILHLPQTFPQVQFSGYQGHWLRCVYTQPQEGQPGYLRSPRIIGLNVRSLGGTVKISQSMMIHGEILGKSDGNPGQKFRLQVTPILPRHEDEYILVIPPEGLPQKWQEVNDFADSAPNELHYTIDSLTGIVQFGPLIREPNQLQDSTQLRSHLQRGTELSVEQEITPLEEQLLERQYGAVPSRGATIQMVRYRTGGGQQGNVQPQAIAIVKTAIPYVAQVVNHQPTYNGAAAESLEDAVIRVPRLLRTRDRAVTAIDFENLALAAGKGAIARVRCLFPIQKRTLNSSTSMSGIQSIVREIERHQALQENEPFVKLPTSLLQQIKAHLTQSSRSGVNSGQVRLLLVGQGNVENIERGEGIHPDSLTISPELWQQVQTYLDQRRLLGVEILYEQPDYVGVTVQTEVALEPEYNTPITQQKVLNQIKIALYRFLNPITGGIEGNGWEFGRPVYSSDIVKLLQTIPGVRHLGTVQLFELRRTEKGWQRNLPREPKIDPGLLGLICSWRDDQLRFSHVINLL